MIAVCSPADTVACRHAEPFGPSTSMVNQRQSRIDSLYLGDFIQPPFVRRVLQGLPRSHICHRGERGSPSTSADTPDTATSDVACSASRGTNVADSRCDLGTIEVADQLFTDPLRVDRRDCFAQSVSTEPWNLHGLTPLCTCA